MTEESTKAEAAPESVVKEECESVVVDAILTEESCLVS